ncbi:type II secretion system F family protein [Alloalcanivorax gelatiniphagus]|uniref:Type II secretion system F family protein n=2 Tax=Alloalcanivorax gelatiniphagus TaxID=1194167 RepID=A0ABY2XIV1_9GAMM|nr:type II secretion system F family protein [Alloalcanivorax gelatiniphagus]
MTPRWIRRTRVLRRLNPEGGDDEDDAQFWLNSLAKRLTESSLAREDYREIGEAYQVTGLSPERAQLLYLLFCWLIPAVVVAAGFTLFGMLPGMMIAAAAFLLPRRTIRSLGHKAEQQQNLEAIELCHMTRMLMEAGLSLERVLRLIAVQGRPMLPALSIRLDRFNRLMESGAERTQALDELGENRNIPVLRSYVILMKQSSQIGAAVSNSLDHIIEEAQNVERNRISEQTNKIGAKMTVIMMAFMLPALFILIGGPAMISIADSLAR